MEESKAAKAIIHTKFLKQNECFQFVKVFLANVSFLINQPKFHLSMCFKNNNIASTSTNMRLRMNTLDIAKCYIDKANDCKGKGERKAFTMSFNNFANLKQQTHCAYSGIKFQEKGDFSFSFERLDNSKGYEDGNVVPVCRFLNTLRSNIETSGDVEDHMQPFIEKINSRRNVLDQTRATISKIENTPLTETKPIISGIRFRHFTQLYNVWKIKQAIIKTREAQIKKAENVLKTATKLKTIKSRKEELMKLKQGLAKEIKVSESNKAEILAMFKDRKSNKFCIDMFSLEDHIVKYRELKDVEERTLANIATYERMISHFKYVKQGLAKFENLSTLDKMCLRIGYPLGTPRAKVIKQAMAMKLANEVY